MRMSGRETGSDDIASLKFHLQLPDTFEDGSAVCEISAHRRGMIQERVFDFVAVRSEETGEIGKCSDAIIDVAGLEKGEHCLYRRVVLVARGLSIGVYQKKHFNFFRICGKVVFYMRVTGQASLSPTFYHH